MLNRQVTVLLFSIVVLALFASIPAPVAGGAKFGHQIYAIPAFSRQYGTSCSTCHVDFPKLNDFGKAFKDAGFKFPKDDETFIKVPPVMLGSPAQKELWPHTIWPGTIPGIAADRVALQYVLQVVGRNRNNFNLQTPGIQPLPSFLAPIFSPDYSVSSWRETLGMTSPSGWMTTSAWAAPAPMAV